MSQDSLVSYVECLTKIAYTKLSGESDLKHRLDACFPLFSKVLPFNTPLELEKFFCPSQFRVSQSVHTLYGTIHSFELSNVMRTLIFRRRPTLQQMFLFTLTQTPPPHMTMEKLLKLPDELFQEFIATLLANLHHLLDQVTQLEEDKRTELVGVIQLGLKMAAFLSDCSEYVHAVQLCRTLLAALRTHFSGPRYRRAAGELGVSRVAAAENGSTRSVRSWPKQPCADYPNDTQGSVNPASSRPSPSENVHSSPSAYADLDAHHHYQQQSHQSGLFTRTKDLPSHSEKTPVMGFARCMNCSPRSSMLRSMNAYNMYKDAEDQQLFLEEAPRLLKTMKHFNLILPPSTDYPLSHMVLPPGLHAPSVNPLNPTLEVKAGATLVPAEKEELPTLPLVSDPGPSGDAASQLVDATESWPPHAIPSNYFPTSATRSSAISDLLNNVPKSHASVAFLQAQLATYHHAMCKYQTAYEFTLLAVEQLRASSASQLYPSAQVMIEVLRIMSKLCMIKRKHDLAIRILQHALTMTRSYYGQHTLVYASLLLEYGYLMLNTDKTRRAARIYGIALATVVNCLPGGSMLASLALESIAYAQYVLEYTSGDFAHGLYCVEVAGVMLHRLHHEVCMQAASANRVRALIIEEIALDGSSPSRTQEYLYIAKRLHIDSLDFCEKIFGFWNIQTAKHYGNLGRLYQSMQDHKEAESMHCKAILIKEHLLGRSDFEVGLSVGHLASLYNYDMERYSDAEKLYLRSIQISLNLFGKTYSGLEFDYRGLQRVYHELGNWTEMRRYRDLFERWQKDREELRKSEPAKSVDELPLTIQPSNSRELWAIFFDLATVYEEEFRTVFHGLDCEADSGQGCGSPRLGQCSSSPALSGPEASRSTGY